MAIRSGSEYRESLQDGRTVFVAGERLADVTAYLPFSGAINSLSGLYDLQHERPDDLTYSDASGERFALSFLSAKSADDVARRQRADELRAETTFGLMGRMPDFMNALVTDAALGMRDHPTLDPAHIENLQRYQRDCRANDWCLTHTLVDPQVDRSRGPAEQADPELVLHRGRETDAGIVVRGTRMLSTLAPFANELWVGSFYPRRPGEEDYALCFAMPMGTPGLSFLCREPCDLGRGSFDRPLSSRFDEEDALAIFDDVLVPWERVFIAGDLTAYNDLVGSGPGLTPLQATMQGWSSYDSSLGWPLGWPKRSAVTAIRTTSCVWGRLPLRSKS
jgi:4-hydroxyphenylacetate 3-monooxygenase/anthranilate 3-monooxygenase (FAD)/4-hydroxyphenylacetate 3-monooxygenase